MVQIYYQCNGGGLNRTHAQVEKTARIDSFTVDPSTGWSTLFAEKERGLPAVLDCIHYMEYDGPDERELLEIRLPNGWNQTVEVSRKRNGFGGHQLFFVCPCGRRVRFLYQSATGFSCRWCSKLNYASQQQNKVSSLYYYDKGLKLLEKHFDSRDKPDGFEFSSYTPRRLRRQHETTYQKHLKRFQRYQQQHTEMELMELSRILKIFE